MDLNINKQMSIVQYDDAEDVKALPQLTCNECCTRHGLDITAGEEKPQFYRLNAKPNI